MSQNAINQPQCYTVTFSDSIFTAPIVPLRQNVITEFLTMASIFVLIPALYIILTSMIHD